MAGRTRWKIYLRRSIVRRARDTVSIDKQRHFAEQWLEENDIPADQVDWFVDAQGHRSARWETTRPEWMRVKAELLLPSTAGLWCFEMDRTHRNVRATAELVETAQNTGLRPRPGDCCVFCSYGSIDCDGQRNSTSEKGD